MCVCNCIVGLINSIKRAENFKSRYQKSFIDLESIYDDLSQQVFKGERQPEGG